MDGFVDQWSAEERNAAARRIEDLCYQLSLRAINKDATLEPEKSSIWKLDETNILEKRRKHRGVTASYKKHT